MLREELLILRSQVRILPGAQPADRRRPAKQGGTRACRACGTAAALGPHATVTVDGQPRVIDSVDTLSSLAQAADRKAGGITAYTFTDGQFEAGATTADLTVRVTRAGGVYDVHVQMTFTDGAWRI